jgi:hypothetical protein
MAHGALVVRYATKSQNKHPEDVTSSAGYVSTTNSRERMECKQMITATFKLTRTADDGAEMFRKYYLVADFADVRGQGKASIIPLSVGAPMPDDEHLTVKGGENEALIAATDLIKGLPGNAGFAAKIDFDPS